MMAIIPHRRISVDIATHTDKIIGVMRRVGSNEAERASGAGEDREEIGSLLELTGLHKRAFAFVRMLDKQEPDKRDDILRSLHPLLNMMDGHWNSQKTPDMFETASTQAGESQADPDEDSDPDDDETDDETDSELDADDDDFERHLDEVSEAAE